MNVCCEAVLVWNWDTVTALCKTGGGDVIGFLTTRTVYNFGHVCLSDCLSDNLRKPGHKTFIFVYPIYLQGMQVRFIYEGHRVRVEVTGAKKVKKSLSPQFTTLNGSNTDSICFRRRHRRLCDVTFVNCASLKQQFIIIIIIKVANGYLKF